MGSMHIWDGSEPSGRFKFDTTSERFRYYIDDGGTVYYTIPEEPEKYLVWCPAGRLTKHLHHLEQIKARYITDLRSRNRCNGSYELRTIRR